MVGLKQPGRLGKRELVVIPHRYHCQPCTKQTAAVCVPQLVTFEGFEGQGALLSLPKACVPGVWRSQRCLTGDLVLPQEGLLLQARSAERFNQRYSQVVWIMFSHH